jgi:hypothetical protein
MRKLIGAVILAALVSGRGATAETVGLAKPSHVAGSPSTTEASSQTIGLPWPAPVGHRQPQAKDLPSPGTNELERISEEDRAVDRKLAICRGC